MTKESRLECFSVFLQFLGVFAVPVAIFLFSQSTQRNTERNEKIIRAHQSVQNYLAKIAELQEKGLSENATLQAIATAHTLALLRDPSLQRDMNANKLEPDFKGQAVEYLSDLALIHTKLTNLGQCEKGSPAISLERADLKGANLTYIYACYVNLENANLQEVNLEGAHLQGANFKNANLKNANLKSETGITTEQLSEAQLCNAKVPENIKANVDRDC
jgi:uncharacterized protein YjbI with pentapeptide repeats